MKDQAEKLRARVRGQTPHRATLIAVTSGKGGVGKSNFALNFALSLIEQGKRALLFDLDLGFANIDVLLGISPRYTIADLLDRNLSFREIVEHGPYGLLLVAGASGWDRLLQLSEEEMERLLKDLQSFEDEVDYILLDTGAGLSKETLPLLLASDEIILVTTPEPTSLTDAYTVLKLLSKQRSTLSVKLVVNRCSHPLEGLQTAQRLQSAAKQFLDQEIHYLGHLVQDHCVQQAVIRQQPFLYLDPSSKASQAVRLMAAQYLNRPLVQPAPQDGGLGGLFRRLVGSFRRSIS